MIFSIFLNMKNNLNGYPIIYSQTVKKTPYLKNENKAPSFFLSKVLSIHFFSHTMLLRIDNLFNNLKTILSCQHKLL